MTPMTSRSLALVILAIGSAAANAVKADDAQSFACVFTYECYETEACAETAYELSLEIAAGFADRPARGVTVSETMTGTAYPIGEGGWMANLGSEIGPALLSLHGGQARLSIHDGGSAMMINYSGTCEGQM